MTAEEVLAEVDPVIRYHAKTIARRCPQSGLTAEDLEQEARAAVVKLLPGYDPEQSKPLSYFSLRIRGAMFDAVRDASFAPRLAVQRGEPTVKVMTFSVLDRKAFDDDDRFSDKRGKKGFGNMRFDPPHHDPPPADDAETEFSGFLRKMFGGLSAQERAIMRWLYVRGWTMKQAGEMLGLSESRISQIHTAIMGKLAAKSASEVAS